MATGAARAMNGTLTEFLNLLDLKGQTWCFVDIRSSGGFSVPPNDVVMFHGVVHGTARLAGVSGGTIELQAGEVAMILSGEAHAVRSDVDSPVSSLAFLRQEQNVDVLPTIEIGKGGPLRTRVLSGRLKVDWLSGLRRTAMPPVVRMGSGTEWSHSTSLRAETLQMFGTGPGAPALLTRIASLMLSLALRSHPQCLLLFRSSENHDPIAHALQLIATDPSADWSVEQLARRVGMGRSSFAARFTAEVGRTPMEAITEKRMQFAADLLQQGELKVVDISARAGYRSEAAFSRRFTRHFGLTPGKMRRSAQLGKTAGVSHWDAVLPRHARAH